MRFMPAQILHHITGTGQLVLYYCRGEKRRELGPLYFLRLPILSSKDLKEGELLMVPILWLMAAPMVDRASEVICPAWEKAS